MIRLFAAAIPALLLLTALPATARAPDSFPTAQIPDAGDWWLVDKYNERRQVVLVEGKPFKHPGGITAYIAYLMYATPKENGETGIAVSVDVDCGAHTVRSASMWTFYRDRERQNSYSLYSEPSPLTPESALYRFACSVDRSSFRHLADGSLPEVVAEAFAPAPGK